MSKQLLVDVANRTETLRDFSAGEQATFDATQALAAQARQARTDAIVSIGFDPTDNVADMVKAQQYVQASNAYLAEAPHTVASTTTQVERNTRAIRAILKYILAGGATT